MREMLQTFLDYIILRITYPWMFSQYMVELCQIFNGRIMSDF